MMERENCRCHYVNVVKTRLLIPKRYRLIIFRNTNVYRRVVIVYDLICKTDSCILYIYLSSLI